MEPTEKYIQKKNILSPVLFSPSSFALKFFSLDRKCLQKRLFKLYRIIRIKYDYRISFSSKIDLKILARPKNTKSVARPIPASPLLQKNVDGIPCANCFSFMFFDFFLFQNLIFILIPNIFNLFFLGNFQIKSLNIEKDLHTMRL